MDAPPLGRGAPKIAFRDAAIVPFTPFHFGPGLLIKAAARRPFSLVAFVVSQVLIDVEPGWNLLRHHRPIHGFWHTFLGSLILVPISALAAIAWCRFRGRDGRPFRYLLLSALIGVWSHVLLDSLLYRDVAPFLPFSSSNPFLGWMSYLAVYLGCAMAGAVGAVIFLTGRSRDSSTAR